MSAGDREADTPGGRRRARDAPLGLRPVPARLSRPDLRQRVADALKALAEDAEVDVILSDQRMPEMTGVELLREAKKIRPEVTRLLFTGYADIKAVIDAINEGNVFRYVAKPWDPEEMISVVRQAVEQHDLIAEKMRLLRDLKETNARLVEAGRLKSAFLEVASHELNTPVAVVLGLAELWKMTQANDATPAERSWVDKIQSAGKRLASVVERMFKLIRSDAPIRAIERAEVDLAELVRKVVADLSPFLDGAASGGRPPARPGPRHGRGRPGEARRHLRQPGRQRDQVHPRRRPDHSSPADPTARTGSRSPWPTGARASAPRTGRTSSSRSSPATTRCTTRRANTSTASAGWAWGSAWSSRSSSCTAGRSTCRVQPGRGDDLLLHAPRAARPDRRRGGQPGRPRPAGIGMVGDVVAEVAVEGGEAGVVPGGFDRLLDPLVLRLEGPERRGVGRLGIERQHLVVRVHREEEPLAVVPGLDLELHVRDSARSRAGAPRSTRPSATCRPARTADG